LPFILNFNNQKNILKNTKIRLTRLKKLDARLN